LSRQVKATRMALLQSKKKLKLASKGHKLLKEKRDALISEFFKVLKEIKSLRKEIGSNLVLAQSALHRAQAIQGEPDVERFALGASSVFEVDISTRKVMSVSIPDVSDINVDYNWYGYFESTVELDDAVKKFREIFPTLIKLSAKQLALKKLADEIKKTKRKVNSLEYIIVPRLQKEKKMITFKLEEQERENFTRLKIIKKKTEAA
jgi:V/A-type H+/Na+-transporting ATPase subunit D